MGLRGQLAGKAHGLSGVLCIAIMLVWSSATKAETRVYLLRGWFGVFSTGLDTLATELRGKGIKAETMGHLTWKTMVSDIIKWRATGDTGPLIAHLAQNPAPAPWSTGPHDTARPFADGIREDRLVSTYSPFWTPPPHRGNLRTPFKGAFVFVRLVRIPIRCTES
jgi:hypothetical protein